MSMLSFVLVNEWMQDVVFVNISNVPTNCVNEKMNQLHLG